MIAMHRVIGILVCVALVSMFYLASCSSMRPTESDIKNAIEEANNCMIASDCASIGNHCPFGCSIFVRKTEKEHILTLILAIQSSCTNDCPPVVGARCVAGKCVAIAQNEQQP